MQRDGAETAGGETARALGVAVVLAVVMGVAGWWWQSGSSDAPTNRSSPVSRSNADGAPGNVVESPRPRESRPPGTPPRPPAATLGAPVVPANDAALPDSGPDPVARAQARLALARRAREDAEDELDRIESQIDDLELMDDVMMLDEDSGQAGVDPLDRIEPLMASYLEAEERLAAAEDEELDAEDALEDALADAN